MRTAAWVLSFALSIPAWAAEPAPSDHESGHRADRAEEENPDVGQFIFHHVADSNQLELEVPLNPQLNVEIPLKVLKFDLTPGACEATANIPSSLFSGFQQLFAGCLDISITKHTVMMWIALGLLILVMLLGANRDKTKLVPRGTGANLLELLVLFVRDEIAYKTIGKKEGGRFTPYLLTAFFFILFMNLLGLIPEMSTATGNLAITMGLALCTFAVTQYGAIKAAGLKTYLMHLTGGVHPLLWPIMVPVEVLGLFTKPFALMVRLFANMLAGHIVIFFLLGLIFILGSPLVAGASVPFAMMIYFLELFVGLIQAYIFTMLSGLFIGLGVAIAHHGHDGEPGHDAHGAAHGHQPAAGGAH